MMKLTGYDRGPILIGDEDKYKKLWGLDNLSTIRQADQSHILKGIRKSDNHPVVLKFTKFREDALREMLALQWYDGDGCVKLLEEDHTNGVLLLDCIEPGAPLYEFFPHRDELAIRACVDVVKRLHKKPVTTIKNFTPLVTFLKPLFLSSDFPRQLLEPLQIMAKELIASSKTTVLLHGDLHLSNILTSKESGWLAIDPKGIVGDAAFEVAPYICFPLPARLERIPGFIDRRVRLFSELLGLDRFRVLSWTIVFSMMMACRLVRTDKEVARNWLSLSAHISSLPL